MDERRILPSIAPLSQRGAFCSDLRIDGCSAAVAACEWKPLPHHRMVTTAYAVSIPANNLAAGLRWYRETLGVDFTDSKKWHRIGSGDVVPAQGITTDRYLYSPLEGLEPREQKALHDAHIQTQALLTDSFDADVALLKGKGLHGSSAVHELPDGGRRFRFRDGTGTQSYLVEVPND